MTDYNVLYEYRDGHLYFKSNRIKKLVGQRAGSLTERGYLRVRSGTKHLKAHRVIWEMHYGPIPDGLEIDHINDVRHDNRIENLRVVSKTTNIRSRKKFRGSGVFVGIVQRVSGIWRARAVRDGKKHHIGDFGDPEDAATAYNFFVLNYVDAYARVNECSQPWLEESDDYSLV